MSSIKYDEGYFLLDIRKQIGSVYFKYIKNIFFIERFKVIIKC
jgi:hypothetical protein